MTPLPKKKMARSRTKTRKSTKSMNLPKLVKCAGCNELKFPHRICSNCKEYK